MAIQWLELPAFTAESPGSIPGQRTKIMRAVWQKKKKKVKKNLIHYFMNKWVVSTFGLLFLSGNMF